ncbi:MAG: MFS transporter [Planctomycetes bacterium]|nr:MFS transporter [Planctomycetota bacterium]
MAVEPLHTPADDPTALEPPTRVRYGVLGFLGAMTFILYLDRVCIGQATRSIQEELGIDNFEMTFINTAFILAYAVFEPTTGRWGDRYGARGVLTRIVVWWSLFTVLTGAAWNFWVLLVIRFLFGAGEAGALPNSALVTRKWFPESMRASAQGFITTAMLIGGAVSPIAAAALIEVVGWRGSFVVFGVIGAIWAAAFYYWFRDNPAEHAAVNHAEVKLILGGQVVQDHAQSHGAIPWRLVLRKANLWLMGGIMNCASAVFYVLIFWYPRYLQGARASTNLESGRLSAMVLAFGAVGCIVGGPLADWRLRATGDFRRAYRDLSCFAFAVAAIALFVALQTDNLLLSAVYTGLAFFFMQTALPSWWATVTKISGKHVGALFGLMNALGAAAAIAAQTFFGTMADVMKDLGYTGREQWDPGFYVYVGILVVGSILWFFVDPRKSLADDNPAG